jgi:outer membrane lipoprotein carrier protein
VTRNSLIFSVIFALLFLNSALAYDFNEIIKRLEDIDTVEAGFQQVTEIKGFGEDSYSGKVYLENGKRVLWDYNEPYDQYYLFTKDSMEYYDSSTEQLIKQDASGSGGNNIVFKLLVDISAIKDAFEISHVSGDTFKLIPKTDVGLQFIKITFSSKYIEKIHSLDDKGNYTTIKFEDVKINSDIPEEKFLPDVPLGTEIFNY